MEGHTRNWHEVLEFGSRLALGGPAIGAVIGLAGAFVLGYVINDALVEVSLTVLLAFATFALCEATRIKVRSIRWVIFFFCGVRMKYGKSADWGGGMGVGGLSFGVGSRNPLLSSHTTQTLTCIRVSRQSTLFFILFTRGCCGAHGGGKRVSDPRSSTTARYCKRPVYVFFL